MPFDYALQRVASLNLMETRDEERLTNLEILITQQDDMVETLSRIVHEQRLQIDIMQEQIKRLQNKMTSAGGGEMASEADETPPPHY